MEREGDKGIERKQDEKKREEIGRGREEGIQVMPVS